METVEVVILQKIALFHTLNVNDDRNPYTIIPYYSLYGKE